MSWKPLTSAEIDMVVVGASSRNRKGGLEDCQSERGFTSRSQSNAGQTFTTTDLKAYTSSCGQLLEP